MDMLKKLTTEVETLLSWLPPSVRLYVGTATSGVVGVVSLLWAWFRFRDRSLPPGPSGWPGVGLKHKLTGADFHVALAKMGKKYGDVFSFYNGTSLTIVLHSESAIREAFVQNADVWACRPEGKWSLVDFMQLDDDIFSVPYQTKGWNKNRAVLMDCLRSAGYGKSRAVEDKILEQMELMMAYLDPAAQSGEPMDTDELFHILAINVIFQVLMSKSYSYDSPELEKVMGLLVGWFMCFDDCMSLEAIPRFLAKTWHRKKVRNIRDNTQAMKDFILAEVKHHKETLDRENPRDFIDNVFIKKGTDADLDKMAFNTMSFTPDAAHTMALGFDWVVLYLGLNPNVQEKIVHEITNQTGGNRHVTWDDRNSLVFVEAVVMEVLRIAPAIPTSAPHAVSQEVWFRGYRIPTRALVYANLYNALQDPVLFPNPDQFKPERFIDKEGKLIISDAFMPFSLGRRRCTGERIAKIELFLFVANFCQRYHIAFPSGVTPTTEPIGNPANQSPHPFKVILKIRE